MAQYKLLISYDLQSPGKDYSTLHKHLKGYPDWITPLESLWIVKTSLSAAQVRDKVKQYIDSNDKLLVVNITGKGSAWKNLSDSDSLWIKNN